MDFSFILPIYKVNEALVTRCIESIVTSFIGSNLDYEIVVVDDGNEPSVEFSSAFMKKNNIVVVKHHKNRSVFQANISGFKIAKGDWILRVDPDDLLFYMDWSSVKKLMQKHSADILMFSRKTGYLPDFYKKLGKYFRSNNPDRVLSSKSVEDFYLENINFCYVTGKVFSRSIIQKFLLTIAPIEKENIYLNMNEDYSIMSCILLNDPKLLISNSSGVYYYFLREDSLTQGNWLTEKTSIDKKLKEYAISKTIVLNCIEHADYTKDRKSRLKEMALHRFNKIPNLLMPGLLNSVINDYSVFSDFEAVFSRKSLLEAFSVVNKKYLCLIDGISALDISSVSFRRNPRYFIKGLFTQLLPSSSFIGKIFREMYHLFFNL